MKMFALALAVMLPCLAVGPAGKSMGTLAPCGWIVGRFHLPALQNPPRADSFRIAADYVTPGKAYLVFHEFTLTGPGHEHLERLRCTLRAGAVGKYQQVATRCSTRSLLGQ
jgi:hypothetical protein